MKRKHFFPVVLALLIYAASALAQAPGNEITKPIKVNHPFQPNEVAVLIVMGQSNAEGWGQWLPDATRSTVRLPNVYGLSRSGAGNLDITGNSVTWENYSIKNFNLGDNYDSASGKGYGSYHLAGEFAQLWQDYLKSYPGGLPDLYVIHMAWGSQGFVHSDAPNDRWSPESNSLFPLAKRVIEQGMLNLAKQGKTPRVVGLHWNQWETEALRAPFKTTEHVESGFRNYLANFRGIFNGSVLPTYLYYPRTVAFDAVATQNIQSAFKRMSAPNNPDNYHLMDAGLSPYFKPGTAKNFGIFADSVHYTGEVQKWFATQQWSHLFDKGILSEPLRFNNPQWTLVSSGDFDSDSKADLVFKRYDSNTYSIRLVNGTTFKNASGQVQRLAAGWLLDQVADFDGDGVSDLLLRQDGSNTYVVWYMNGLAPKPASGMITQPHANWVVVQAADFDGDGQADLLFNDPGTSNYVIWHMRGLAIKTGSLLQGIPKGWSVLFAADFDGDQRADLLLKENASDKQMIWYSDGFSPKAYSGLVSQAVAGWSVIKVADFDGDARADLLFQQDGTNNYVIWYMNGLTPKSSSGVITRPGADWYVSGVKDYDGDRKADLLFKQKNAENYLIWYMNGLTYKSVSGIFTHP